MGSESADRVPLPSEEIHTPNPHPARGIYGFVLYLVGWISLFAYLIWAIVPTPVLESIGVTYVPAKYWAIAVPLLVPIIVCSYLSIIFCINLIKFKGIFDNVEIVEKDFGDNFAIFEKQENEGVKHPKIEDNQTTSNSE